MLRRCIRLRHSTFAGSFVACRSTKTAVTPGTSGRRMIHSFRSLRVTLKNFAFQKRSETQSASPSSKREGEKEEGKQRPKQLKQLSMPRLSRSERKQLRLRE